MKTGRVVALACYYATDRVDVLVDLQEAGWWVSARIEPFDSRAGAKACARSTAPRSDMEPMLARCFAKTSPRPRRGAKRPDRAEYPVEHVEVGGDDGPADAIASIAALAQPFHREGNKKTSARLQPFDVVDRSMMLTGLRGTVRRIGPTRVRLQGTAAGNRKRDSTASTPQRRAANREDSGLVVFDGSSADRKHAQRRSARRSSRRNRFGRRRARPTVIFAGYRSVRCASAEDACVDATNRTSVADIAVSTQRAAAGVQHGAPIAGEGARVMGELMR